MTGYDVVTTDDHKIGSVVDERGDYLVVERGLLRKSRHALPKVFAHPSDSDRLVRVSVGEDVLADSPRVGDGPIDEQAVALHYGLAAGSESPDTLGRGEVLPDDPAEGSVPEGERHGVASPERTRADIREGRHDEETPQARERMGNAADPFGQSANLS